MTGTTDSWTECDLLKMRHIKEFLEAHPQFRSAQLDRAVREDNLVQAERLVRAASDRLRDVRTMGDEHCRRSDIRVIRVLVHQLIWQDMRAKVA